ncbi:hypothetical protein ACOMHN_041803 [Nucella lapillus]
MATRLTKYLTEKEYLDVDPPRKAECTTAWVNLEDGIAMDCAAISPILFALSMEVILKATTSSPGPADLGSVPG